jgi:hypothetical protein
MLPYQFNITVKNSGVIEHLIPKQTKRMILEMAGYLKLEQKHHNINEKD